MKKVKQVLGIDVSKDTLAICYGFSTETQTINYFKSLTFRNDLAGFNKFWEWVNEVKDKGLDISYVMEATGVYYENLAYFLSAKEQNVHVLLPNKAKHFAKSLDIKSKTDEIDAKMLAQIGLERQLLKWQPQSENLHTIKQLCREYKDLKEKLTIIKNQLHAREHAYNSAKQVVKRLKTQAKLLQAQLLQVEYELREMCSDDEELDDKISKIQTIPGLSFITIITIIAETNAFLLIENSKQLCSYCGLDVVHNQSGLFKGKSKISKKGNRFIRRALFMPALCAIQHNPTLKEFYDKLIERKKVKKVGITAVVRKMLVLTYTLWKNNSEFEINYKKAA
ncbi:MAG: IS110 family transposase [Bacteroidota bacterium]